MSTINEDKHEIFLGMCVHDVCLMLLGMCVHNVCERVCHVVCSVDVKGRYVQFSPSTFLWFQESNSGQQACTHKCLYLPCPLTAPQEIVFKQSGGGGGDGGGGGSSR